MDLIKKGFRQGHKDFAHMVSYAWEVALPKRLQDTPKDSQTTFFEPQNAGFYDLWKNIWAKVNRLKVIGQKHITLYGD